MRSFAKLVFIGSVSSLTLATAALAQDTVATPASNAAPGLGADDIIVTATKREQTLQDVPISVSVTSADTIEKAHIVDLIDLQSVVPSLKVDAVPDAPARPTSRSAASATATATTASRARSACSSTASTARAPRPRSTTCPRSSASRCCAGRSRRCSARTCRPARSASSPRKPAVRVRRQGRGQLRQLRPDQAEGDDHRADLRHARVAPVGERQPARRLFHQRRHRHQESTTATAGRSAATCCGSRRPTCRSASSPTTTRSTKPAAASRRCSNGPATQFIGALKPFGWARRSAIRATCSIAQHRLQHRPVQPAGRQGHFGDRSTGCRLRQADLDHRLPRPDQRVGAGRRLHRRRHRQPERRRTTSRPSRRSSASPRTARARSAG